MGELGHKICVLCLKGRHNKCNTSESVSLPFYNDRMNEDDQILIERENILVFCVLFLPLYLFCLSPICLALYSFPGFCSCVCLYVSFPSSQSAMTNQADLALSLPEGNARKAVLVLPLDQWASVNIIIKWLEMLYVDTKLMAGDAICRHKANA